MKGYSPAAIADELGMKRREVTSALRDWRDLLRQETMTSLDIKDKVMDILVETEESMRTLQRRALDTADQADSNGQYGTKVQALRLYRDVTKDIHDIFDKAGVGQDAEVIEEMNRQEEAINQMIELLKEIKQNHPEVNELISRRLARITQGDVEVMEIARGEETDE